MVRELPRSEQEVSLAILDHLTLTPLATALNHTELLMVEMAATVTPKERREEAVESAQKIWNAAREDSTFVGVNLPIFLKQRSGWNNLTINRRPFDRAREIGK